MPSLRRAVVTGLGLISPIGLGTDAFREALRERRSGVHRFRLVDPSAMPIRFGGEIEEFDPLLYLDKKERKQLKYMIRTIRLAVAAARLALRESGWKGDPERLGLSMGTGILPGEMGDLAPAGKACDAGDAIDLQRWPTEGMPLISPMWMLNHVPNMPASHAAILEDARGPNNTVIQGPAAALMAVGEAFRIVQHGRADAMLAGGTDTRTATINVVRWHKYVPHSRREDQPERACQPFGKTRDGQVLGEGAGVLLLEEREHAQRRGAAVIGEVVGFGSAFDLRRDGTGLTRAIAAALREAGIGPGELDHANAAGAGSLTEDAIEARGLRQAVGSLPVLAMKSWMGDAGCGASLLELAGSLVDAEAPGTLNHEGTADDCPVEVMTSPRRIVKPFVLKTAMTERGQCAALVVRREVGP